MTNKQTKKTEDNKKEKTSKKVDINEQLLVAQKSAKDNWEKVLRAQAEIENIKRRAATDLENAHKYALDGFVKALLEVKDSLTMGLKLAKENKTEVKQITEGLEMTNKVFLTTMEKFGVKAIGAVGEKFNPEIHEAITMMEVPKKKSNTVVEIIQEGFTLNSRIIRPAMVIVAK